jgi:integrase
MRQFNKLNTRKIAAIRKAGRYGDGLNLWLEVSDSGNKSWIYRYMLNGRSRDMGLGPLHSVGLAEAREKAKDVRKSLLAGCDPLEERRAADELIRAHAARTLTFAACADLYLKEHLGALKNDKHRQQWRTSIETANGAFGSLNVASVDTAMVMKLLEPIWQRTPETGSRIRSRIEKVLAWATARELRSGPNPARWVGHLDTLLRKPKKGDHHSAMPFEQVPAFMALLRSLDSISARALEFTILTACRTGEVLGAKWDEVDLDKGIFTIPANRMKAGVEHEVPLAARAVCILRDMPRVGDYIFPGAKHGKPLSNMAMLQMMRGKAGNGYTTHGMRSAFNDWAADQTNFPREVVQHALAHKLPDKVEAAYRRRSALPKRVKLMEAWAKYCERPCVADNNVTNIGAARNG